MWKTTIISPSSQQANYTVIVFVSDNTYMWLDLIGKFEIFWIHHLTDRTGIGKKTERECLCYGKPLASFLCTFQRLRSIDNTAIFVLWRKNFKKSLTLFTPHLCILKQLQCNQQIWNRLSLSAFAIPWPEITLCRKDEGRWPCSFQLFNILLNTVVSTQRTIVN